MKNPKIALLIVPFLTALTLFLLTMVFLSPRLKELGGLKKNNAAYRKTLNLLTSKTALLEGTDEDELRYRVETTITALPVEKDLPMASIFIKSLAKETGLNIKKMEIESSGTSTASAKGAILPSFNIKITAETEADKIVPFFERAQTALPIISLDKVSLTSKGLTTFEISLVINNFYLDYPEKIGSPETPLPQISSQEESTYQLISEKFKPLVGLEVVSEAERTGPMGKPNPFIP